VNVENGNGTERYSPRNISLLKKKKGKRVYASQGRGAKAPRETNPGGFPDRGCYKQGLYKSQLVR